MRKAAESNDRPIYIDLIEPKFDPTHEVSRAMVEFNRFIEPYCEELEKLVGIKIGTAIFNRKVWASTNDKDDPYLRKDHYLFSNLSSKFTLEKKDYGLFHSLLQSIQVEKSACSDVECEKHTGINKDYKEGLFDEIHKEDWEDYVKQLNDIYKDIPKDKDPYLYYIGPIEKLLEELLASESEFKNAFKDTNNKVRKHVEKHARSVFRNLITLLRMPVLGGFPGTLANVHMNELNNYKESKNDQGSDQNIISYFSLRHGELVECESIRQLGIFEEAERIPGPTNAKGNKPIVYFSYPSKQKSDKENIDGKIFNILTKLYQLLAQGSPIGELAHILFISVPIHKSYYPEIENVNGTIAGFLQGWVFIPIELGKPVSDFVESLVLDSPKMDSLKKLIEGCLIAGNMLVENVRSAGARRAVGHANVDADDIIALSYSIHHMTGWIVTPGDSNDEDKLDGEYQRWGDGTERNPVIVRLGNRVGNGEYEVGDTGKVIRLTKTDESYVKPLGGLKDDLSGEDVYLKDLAQRLRTVHSLIIDKSQIARTESFRGYQKSMHSVPEAISSIMEDMIDHARSCPNFEVPSQLYLLSVESAVRAKYLEDWDKFQKYIPLPGSILTTLQEKGFNREVIEDVLTIAKPLAIMRLQSRGIFGDIITKLEISEGVLKPEYNPLELGVVIAILVNMLKESIEHTEVFKNRKAGGFDVNFKINVEIQESTIVISNPCMDATKYNRNGASNEIIFQLATFLEDRNSKWKVELVKPTEGCWKQRLKYNNI